MIKFRGFERCVLRDIAYLGSEVDQKPKDSEGLWWAHKGSNLGPLPCEGNALPLSYAPGRLMGRQKGAIYEVGGGGVKLNTDDGSFICRRPCGSRDP